MSGKNSGSNQVNVPEAKEAMDRFKMEVANELGVPEWFRWRLYGQEDD